MIQIEINSHSKSVYDNNLRNLDHSYNERSDRFILKDANGSTFLFFGERVSFSNVDYVIKIGKLESMDKVVFIEEAEDNE